jgi:hypothetical protein
MDNYGLEILKAAFNKLAEKYDVKDMAARALRSVAAGGKEAVKRGMQEFPKAFVQQVAKDLYDLISSQETADGISAVVRSFDEEKVKTIVDGLVSQLKDHDTALKLASQIKKLMGKTSGDDIETQLDAFMSMNNISPMGRMLFSAFFGQIKPILDDMKDASDEEVAEKIMELADAIPGDMIAAQVGQITSQITPERVSKQAHDILGKLPSPQTIADITHAVGDSAAKHFDEASKINDPAELTDIAKDFAQEAADVVSKKGQEDLNAKKTFKKGPGKFDDI